MNRHCRKKVRRSREFCGLPSHPGCNVTRSGDRKRGGENSGFLNMAGLRDSIIDIKASMAATVGLLATILGRLGRRAAARG